MSKLPALCAAAALATALLQPAASEADAPRSKGGFLPISSYEDDPFAEDSVVERMSRSEFDPGPDGRPALKSSRAAIVDEPVIYRRDPATGVYYAFAWNPWLPELVQANDEGHFAFPDEERFPLLRVQRGPDGKVVLVDGLQLWLPQDLHRGMTTAFEAAHAVKQAVELWSGREVRWGDRGYLEINSHAFIDMNAFFSPSAKMLFFGVVPHRLPGEPPSAPVKMFETATSWEIAAHESGHALHAELKPNRDNSDLGYRTWSESFGDQVAMWTSLRDEERALGLVEETNGNLARSNRVTGLGEVYGALIGNGAPLRDAFHEKKVSDTSPELHERSEVLTGAAYRVFLAIYDGLRREHGAAKAAAKAARVLGTFLTRAADFTPEVRVTLEDVAKAYLKVDKELFGSRYHALLVDELTRRELLDESSLGEWREHEASIPALALAAGATTPEIEAWLQAHLDELGIGSEFGLRLQRVGDDNPARSALARGRTIVRVQLTLGRGEGAAPLDNYGLLVFRPNGTLADYHSPLPADDGAASRRRAASAQVQARALIDEARARGLHERGAPLSIVRKTDGELTTETRVLRSEGMESWMEVFSLDHPEGERREVVIPPVPPDLHVPVAEDLLE